MPVCELQSSTIGFQGLWRSRKAELLVKVQFRREAWDIRVKHPSTVPDSATLVEKLVEQKKWKKVYINKRVLRKN